MVDEQDMWVIQEVYSMNTGDHSTGEAVVRRQALKTTHYWLVDRFSKILIFLIVSQYIESRPLNDGVLLLVFQIP